MSKISEHKRQWEQTTLEKSLARFPEQREQFETLSSIPVERLYTPDDVEADYLGDLGFPGQPPFTRGVQPTMYRGRFWTMRQYAGYATAEESNQRYQYLLEQGQTGLSVAFDLPTQIGYDSDHPMAEGEVGKVGVAISSLEDMETLLDGIPLDKVSTSMTINAPASVLLAMYVAVAKKQGVRPEKLRGTIQNDILKEYVARGTYIFPPRPSMRLITDTFSYCGEHLPRWNTISICGYHIREAGSTAVQEVAFTLANGIAYVQAALDAGLDVDDFAPRLSFFFNAHNNLFEEAAKFRAARRLWGRIMKERFGAQNPQFVDAALSYPDRRLHPHRPAARQQRGAGDVAGAGGRAGRHPIAAHQLPRRGPLPADGGIGADRSAHPADHRPRIWRGRHC